MKEIINKTSAGGVVVKDGLILTIKWLSQNTIEFPKGTVEDNELSSEAAVREVKEEKGYDAEIIDDLGDITYDFNWTDGKHYRKTVTFYLMNLINNDKPIPSREEGEDFENMWLTAEETKQKLSHDDSLEILNRALDSPKFRL